MYIKLFYTIIEISIKASILVGVILLIKSILGEKIGAKNQFFLWFLLIIKLILPNINLRFLNVFSRLNPYHDVLNSNTVLTKGDIISWFNTTFNEHSFNVSTDLVKSNINIFSFEYIMPTIWILGILTLMIYMIVSNIKFNYVISHNKIEVGNKINDILKESKKRLNIDADIDVYKSPFIYSPCLYGLLKPSILLPENIEEKIDVSELKYVISHELAHFKRKDIFTYMLIYILKVVYWFNPVIWYGLFRMKNDCEVACDALALSSLEGDEKESYGLSLIHLLERNRPKLNNIITTEFINTKKYLKRRIIMIKKFKKSSYKMSFVTILLFVLVAGVFFANGNIDAAADKFEENNNATEENIDKQDMIWPTPKYTKISSTFGKKIHPVLKKESMHTGIDIPGKKGGSIVAAADGKVILADLNGGYGKTVIIDHGDGLVSLYGHCSELLVEEDQEITAGTEIAKIGMSGMSTGPHLHFEVRKDEEAVHPLGYIIMEEDK
ncbi:M56 family metallopeptidase [Clostridiisalibacter paucivorans]|uniref:M56 family metallopeptidase n=1 Tax=Clostridiisalibacter paucivorans TaxID=408753 RepID=UPI00047C1E2E|nr:M56 family metallopeptidase [Clostridiisalibacter paucivorans]